MTEPVDPIFQDQNDPEETPTSYIANPVRVQLPKYEARFEGRRWTQMDLVALANNILAREQECIELRKEVRALSIQFSGMRSQLDALQVAAVRNVSSNAVGGKVGRILTAIEKILNDDEDDEY